MMRPPIGLFIVLVGSTTASLTGCLDRGGLESTDAGGGSSDAGRATGGRTSTGGSPGSGGIEASGGTPGTGGTPGSGGLTGTGGAAATGGKPGTGGNPGSGGGGAVPGTGGANATGGTGSGGTGGQRMCPPVCQIYCQYGNVTDANGCPTCGCKPPPVCPAIACLVACPYGYGKDPATGCTTCACNPDPNACATADCGPTPTEPVTVVCPAAGVPPAGGTATGAAAAPAAGTASDVAATTPGATALVAPPPPPAYACERGSDGKCGWQKGGCRICSAVTCKLYCEAGWKTGTDGCPICACNPPPPVPVCGTYSTYNACVADALCTWLQPGCGQPALAAAGCYAKSNLGCASDLACGQGHQCLKRYVSTCPPGATCPPVCEIQTICQ
jgi:hypothetical protein